MATREEIKKRMAELPPTEADKAKKVILGSTEPTFDQLCNATVGEPGVEAKLCHMIGLPTETERVALATIEAACHARKGVTLGYIAIGIAVFSAVIGVASFVIAWIALAGSPSP